MGRYYSGDIEGKFWFGLQSSNAADRFGVIGSEPSYLDYFFSEDDLEEVENEIKNIEDSLGEKKQILDVFFKEGKGYTNKSVEELGVSTEELSDYADLKLGIKIKKHIENFGQCEFQAEL